MSGLLFIYCVIGALWCIMLTFMVLDHLSGFGEPIKVLDGIVGIVFLPFTAVVLIIFKLYKTIEKMYKKEGKMKPIKKLLEFLNKPLFK